VRANPTQIHNNTSLIEKVIIILLLLQLVPTVSNEPAVIKLDTTFTSFGIPSLHFKALPNGMSVGTCR
jgi:hypothetical protein